ncbi:MAG: hypothetical protein ACPGGK_12885 [Pikeienuella sp.]
MLRLVLQANAGSCVLFGALFAFAGEWTAEFLGNPPVTLIQVLGIGLLVNAAALLWTSMKARPKRAEIFFFAFGDGVWVVATIVLLINGLWITTFAGMAWTIGIAFFVGVCGLLQTRLALLRN